MSSSSHQRVDVSSSASSSSALSRTVERDARDSGGGGASSSISATTTSSTPSKVLSDKFNQLDQQWEQHKSTSPIPVRRRRTASRYKDSNVVVGGGSSDSRHGGTGDSVVGRSRTQTQSTSVDVDELYNQSSAVGPGIDYHTTDEIESEDVSEGEESRSVGSGTISTLSSTESVHDRLYRQGLKSPRTRTSTTSRTTKTSTSVQTPPQQSRRKNRLGAYQHGSTLNRNRIGRNDDQNTPHRRWTNSSLLPATASSDSSRKEEEDLSTFHRLYRNEKRNEKLWQKPPQFSPVLNTKIKTSSMEDDHPHRAQQHSTIENNPIDELGPSPIPLETVASTTLDEDLEAIIALGRQIGDDGRTTATAAAAEMTLENLGTTPTITTTSLSSSDAIDSHGGGQYLLRNGTEHESVRPSLSTLDDDVQALEELGQELKLMEENRHRFESGGTTTVPTTTSEDAAASTIIPENSTKSTTSGTDIRTETTANETYGFFTLDQPSRSYFFAERVDRLSSPFHRRRGREVSHTNATKAKNNKSILVQDSASLRYDKENNYTSGARLGEPFAFDAQPLLTPRRIRSVSAITVQTCWRKHTAELALTSQILSTWRTNVSTIGTYRPASRHLRRAALYDAIRIVPCWWILEGFHCERNWVSVAWENEVKVGSSKVLVQVTCDAKTPGTIAGIWTGRKMSILLVKSALIRAFRRECGVSLIAKWYRRYRGRLNRSATLIQQFWSQVKNHDDKNDNLIIGDSQIAHRLRNSWSNALGTLPHKAVSSDLKEEPFDIFSSAEEAAAITIQCWFRLIALKAALKNVPSTAGQLHRVLNTDQRSSPPTSPNQIDLGIIRHVLRNSQVGKRLTDSYFLRTDASNTDFISRQAASLAIQNIVRAYLTGLTIFRRKKKATILQAHVRGYLARKRIEESNYAAVVIQFAWSNYRYLDYQNLNAIVIQRFWRRLMYQGHYQMALFCTILIQSSWRRALERQKYVRIQKATNTVQSFWRMYSRRRKYCSMISAVQSLQHTFRRHIVLEQYRYESWSAVVVQSWWRMVASRIRLEDTLKAVITIQAAVRGNTQLRNFHSMRRGVILVQRNWRMEVVRRKFERIVHSAVVLQQRWRGFSLREQFLSSRYAAIRIQAIWRAAMAVSVYRSNIRAVILLQSVARSMNVHNELEIQKASAIQVQRFWRGMIGRRAVEILRMSLIDESAVLIQSWWRTRLRRAKYIQTVENVLLLQAVARGMLARKHRDSLLWRRREVLAAVRIQSAMRCFVDQHQFRNKVRAVIVIQAASRRLQARQIHAHLSMNQIRRRQEVESAVLIQSMWRGTLERSQLMHLDDCALKIQSFWRGNQDQCYYMVVRSSVVLVQTFVRRFLARQKYVATQEACTKIQKLWRSSRVILSEGRTRQINATKSATVIQTEWRAAIARQEFMLSRNGAITIQANVRMLSASRRYKILVIEERRRRAWELSILKSYNDAAVVIQSFWRMHSSKKAYKAIKSHATAIQAIGRGYLARSVTNSQQRTGFHVDQNLADVVSRASNLEETRRKEVAVVVIQSKWRSAVALSNYMTIRVACIVIQSFARGMIEREKNRRLLQQTLSATLIQRRFRAFTQETVLIDSRRKTAIAIQAFGRGFMARRQYRSTLNVRLDQGSNESTDLQIGRVITETSAVVIIQSYWRRSLRLCEYTELRIAAITIQAAYRGLLSRRRCVDINEARSAAILIQKHTRCYIVHTRYVITRICVLMIQSMWRGILVRSEWRFVQHLGRDRNVMDSAARTIQVAFVLWKMENAVWEMKSLAVLLKRGVRGQLIRSAVFFALRHMNSSTFPTIVDAYDRVVLANHGVEPIIAWTRALSQAKYSACVVIQSYARRMIVRSQLRSKYGVVFETSLIEAHTTDDEERSALLIQYRFRSWMRFRNDKCIAIQKIVRSWIIRKVVRRRLEAIRWRRQTNAAVRIQAFWNMYSQRKVFSAVIHAVVVYQAAWRRYRSRLEFRKLKRSVEFCQKAARKSLVQRREQEAIVRRDCAAVSIQTLVRAVLSRQFVSMKVAQTREREAVVRRHAAAVKIQTLIRVVLAGKIASNRRKQLTNLSKVILDRVITRVHAASNQQVQNLLQNKMNNVDARLAHLVERTNFAIKISASEKLESLALSQSAHPSSTKIPLPVISTPRNDAARDEPSMRTVTTPQRSNAKGAPNPPYLKLSEATPANSITDSNQDDKGTHLPSLRSLIEGARKQRQQIVQTSTSLFTKSVTPDRATDIQSQPNSLPSQQPEEYEESAPSFDVASPIEKAETSAWDWTESW